MIRTVLCAAAVTAATLLGAGLAAADPAPQLSAQDLAAARAATATASVHDQLVHFTYPGAARAPLAAGPSATIGGQAIPVYELSARFVTGAPGAAPGTLAYVAVPATDGAGRAATLWSARTGADWQVVNVASGNREAALAAALPAGAYLLHEPQVDAWYAVSGDSLRSLDGETAGKVYSTADYQRTVAARYADKLSGSRYASEGRAGGFTALSGREDTGTAAGSGGVSPGLVALVGGFALVGAGVIGSVRRVRRNR
ncbi:hypothetical protein GCM10010174_64210 [Kutzneria viridogrisea]|uniref:Uncharacterized protein n=1 Tax=Kutzneria viridogrisea TaxID=47990 RepID=A0ABR6BFL3_9PSEU|nr:hypothetical protein [Kutzneria viridogrisea]